MTATFAGELAVRGRRPCWRPGPAARWRVSALSMEFMTISSLAVRARAMMLSASTGDGDEQRAGPGEPLPVVVGAQRELEDDDRQARHRRVQVGAEELVVERGEQQRRGLAADAGDGQQDAGHDAGAARRGRRHVAITWPARHAERGRRLAQLARHQAQHVLGGAHDDRNDDDRRAPRRRPSRRNGPSARPRSRRRTGR